MLCGYASPFPACFRFKVSCYQSLMTTEASGSFTAFHRSETSHRLGQSETLANIDPLKRLEIFIPLAASFQHPSPAEHMERALAGLPLMKRSN